MEVLVARTLLALLLLVVLLVVNADRAVVLAARCEDRLGFCTEVLSTRPLMVNKKQS
jgi:hypothetical protein